MADLLFRNKVDALIASVPLGQVTTYGDIAGLAGHAYASRVVGGMAHSGDQTLPWHRMVNRFGGLAAGYHGGREAQAAMLRSEGVEVDENYIVTHFKDLRWKA